MEEIQKYVEKKNVYQIINDILAQVYEKRPENPILEIINYLHSSYQSETNDVEISKEKNVNLDEIVSVKDYIKFHPNFLLFQLPYCF